MNKNDRKWRKTKCCGKKPKREKKQVFKKMIDSQKIGNFFFLIFSLKKIFR